MSLTKKDHFKSDDSDDSDALHSLSSQNTDLAAQNSSSDDAKKDEPSSQADAYNPETGEINWDCPCIAGMVKPPCGDTFKAAFSCFVYSTDEPKGLNCVEHFREMQKCFREYPDVYGEELEDEDESQAIENNAAAVSVQA
ncbi:Oxidoreductase [Nowakowskiella sp. JEL0407]|nr:Oxidoreductase [Nowakowskiella sp. JEL0407]